LLVAGSLSSTETSYENAGGIMGLSKWAFQEEAMNWPAIAAPQILIVFIVEGHNEEEVGEVENFMNHTF